MRIALIGFGKMGKMVYEISKDWNVEVVTIIDPFSLETENKKITYESVKNADVCVDFSTPDCIIENINLLIEMNKNIIVGTTGWYDNIDSIKSKVIEKNIGFLYASNFSIGMNIFYKIIEYSSKVFEHFKNYDVSGLELHHNLKLDSPSGTARELANIIMENLSRKEKHLFGNTKGKIDSTTLQFASIRCGSIPGIHKIIFDSFSDTIELTHSVRNRRGFAEGALLAAKWIQHKKGFYTFKDLMNELLNKEEL